MGEVYKALVDRIVTRCLAKDPDERWQSAADLMRDLKWIADTRTDVSMPTSAVPTRRGPLKSVRVAWAVAVVAVLAAVAVAAVTYVRRTPVDTNVYRSTIPAGLISDVNINPAALLARR